MLLAFIDHLKRFAAACFLTKLIHMYSHSKNLFQGKFMQLFEKTKNKLRDNYIAYQLYRWAKSIYGSSEVYGQKASH